MAPNRPAAKKKTAAAAPAKAKANAKAPGAAKAPKAPKASKAPPAAKPAGRGNGAARPAKPKLVRDSFTIPRDEHRAIDALKARGEALGRRPKKSELLRAGLLLLTRLSDEQLVRLFEDVPPVKTGRPKGAASAQPAKKAARKSVAKAARAGA